MNNTVNPNAPNADGGEPLPPPPQAQRLGDMLGLWQQEAEAAREAFTTGTPRGPVTGLPRLDKIMSGFLAPGVHVCHGNAGSGKTALCLQIAATCGVPSLYVSAEMSGLELFRRVISRTTGAFLGRLKTGEYSVEEAMRMARFAANEAPNLLLADASSGAVADPGWIEETCLLLKEQSGKAPLLIVDSMHSWAVQCAPTGMDERDFLNAGITVLRQIGLRLGSPVLTIAERNRASMKEGGLNAAAGTRQFEYAAETVWDIERETKKEPDANGEVPVYLKLQKNRHGATAGVKLLFHGALQRFKEEGKDNDA